MGIVAWISGRPFHSETEWVCLIQWIIIGERIRLPRLRQVRVDAQELSRGRVVIAPY